MCGVFGVFNDPEALKKMPIGLFLLQHRGQESAGMAWCENEKLKRKRGMGLVADIFSLSEQEREHKETEQSKQAPPATTAIGHTRYSTRGKSILENAQPHLASTSDGKIALASNGDIVNIKSLKNELRRKGVKFYTTNDGELLVKMIAYYYDRFKENGSNSTIEYFQHIDWIAKAIKETIHQAKGAISALLLTQSGELIAFRDPLGMRPLVYGYNEPGGAWFFASETCALDPLKVDYQGEILPGEIRVLGKGMNRFFCPSYKLAHCIFEHIYFSRPDGWVFGEYGAKVKMKLGAKLAEEHPLKADYVIPVPDSSNYAALGYSKTSGIPFMLGIIRHHYIGRTFILPKQEIRDFEARLKLNPVGEIIKDKIIIVVDDSIVRATTSRKLVRMLKRNGAKEVHMRISSPPIKCPCFFGIDTPIQKELIASDHTVEETRKHICADTLGYLSLEGLLSSVKNPKNYCTACFSGDYPMDVSEKLTL